MGTRRTKIVATIGPASRDPEVAGPDGRGGDGRRPAELLARDRRRARRDRRRWSARRPAAPGRQVASCRTCRARSCGSARCATGSPSSSPATRRRSCAGRRRRGDARDVITWAGLADTVEPDEIIYLADGAVRLRVAATRPAAARSTRSSRSAARSPPPGPQHPGRDPRAAVGAGGGPRPRPHRRADRSRPRGAVVRAPCRGRRRSCAEHTRLPLIAKIEKPQAVDERRGDHAAADA